MCLICVEIQKGKLTALEARQNLNETYKTMTKEHIIETLKLIWEKEDSEFNSYIKECEI